MTKKIKRGSQIGKEGRGGKRINHYAALNLHRETAVQTHRSRIVKQWGCLFTSHRISYITRKIKEIKWVLEGVRRLILFELIKRLHLWNRFMQTFCLLIFSCFMNSVLETTVPKEQCFYADNDPAFFIIDFRYLKTLSHSGSCSCISIHL